LDCKDRYCF